MDNIENIIEYASELKLLYVEDNQEARESTTIILEEFFNNIQIAVNGEDGFEQFKANDIDLIITDINMPKLNGLDMISKIRDIDKNIPILVLSAYNESGFFIDSIKLGVEGYLLKPIDIDQFLTVLSKVVEKLKLKIDAHNNLHLLHQYQEATDHSAIVSKTNLSGIITYVNSKFIEISGYTKEELIGNNHNIIRHPDNPKDMYKDMWDTIKNKKQIWKGIVRNISKDKKLYYVKTTIKPILDKNNNTLEYIALRDDITDIMNPKKQLEDLVNTTEEPLAVMIKIEEFEEVEKLYGTRMVHKIEDKFSDILMKHKPKFCEFEKVFPLGYGKYVFATNKNECQLDIDDIILTLKEFQKGLNKLKIDAGDFDYDISVIISLAYGKDVLENLNYGITKLQETKEDFIIANNLSIQEYETAQVNMKTIAMVKTAINNFKVVSYFQSIINNKTQEIEKYESLVRIIDEDGKVLSPFFFLDTAKKGKYYSQITNIVLSNSFEALNSTNKEVSINISALDIEHFSTRIYILKLLEKFSQESSRIVFELLEDENVKDFNTIKKFINDVKKMGVKIAIDDFGAGYSNFERLLHYQPDILKIDGCLVKDIVTNSYSLSVVKTIVSFAKEQNIQTVAEFVENEEIFNILNDLGVDYSQGYYFSEPKPLELYTKKTLN